ncbi:unnamed protein product [Bursaphelenchus okinawaensis]|uniref:Transthyretin-like family protein n=1 Tax=Bursaphelenchus okinawaensis TaxID=465554 RepID=A0A811KU06_9BILA|nr:unnamed protein product [Bursaphelenchus okinawaensis]CAG9110135.1 unnamed protein product [Bursaphelenchus okinawaensis]
MLLKLVVGMLLVSGAATVKCGMVSFTGKVLCGGRYTDQAVIELYEEDLFFDDYVGDTTPNKQGAYAVSGYVGDGWFDWECEPYVFVIHRCKNKSCRAFKNYGRSSVIDLDHGDFTEYPKCARVAYIS